MKKKVLEVVSVVVLMSGIIVGMWVLTKTASEIPMVYWSHATNACVKVVVVENDIEVEKDCSELPDKFHKIWVK